MSRGILAARVAALLILATSTGYALYLAVLLPLRCGHAASLSASAFDAAGQRTGYLTRRATAQLRTDLKGCECAYPPDARVFVALGGASLAAGDARSAIAAYQRALTIDRRPEIYFNLGLAQLDALDRSAAIDNLVRACAFDPARLAEIPYEEIRLETERRLRAMYGPSWIPSTPG